jgi:hypothetical protein
MRWLILGVVVGCGGGDDTGEPGLCLGGGTAQVTIGEQGVDSFAPWTEGQAVTLTDSNGVLKLNLDALVTGMDTSEQTTVLLRVGWEGSATDDYLTAFNLRCDEETGESPISMTADLPEAFQANPSPLLGPSVPLTLIVTDAAGSAAEQSLGITLQTQ